MKPVQRRFILIAKVEKSNDVINDVMSCHAWITCQWRERTDLKECILNNCWNKFDIYTLQGSLFVTESE